MPARMKGPQLDEQLVRVESNLEEYPLFAVKARNRTENQLVFERRQQGEGGTELVQRWEVEPPAKLGMPGPFDQDVYLAVLQLLELRGGMPRNGELTFSLYELREILGWSTSGNAFYSKAEERFLSDTFQIWSVHFSRTKQGTATRERHTLRFHPIFIRNYMAQYLKGLDPEFYWSLSSPLSKRLYRLIDHQRDGGLAWQTELSSLRQQVPLSNYSYPSEIKRILTPAHEELIKRGFLASVSYEGKAEVSYRIAAEFARRQKARELSGGPGELFAIERLVAEGIRGDVARDLVAHHGSEKCLRYADALQHQKGIRSRTGWLRRAIEHGYELPDTLPLPDNTDTASPPLLSEQDTGQTPPLGDSQHVSSDTQSEPAPPPVADPDAQAVWDVLLKELTQESNGPSSSVWFEGIVPTTFTDSTLIVHVPNSFALEYIETRFGERLRSALTEQVGPDAKLVVQASDDANSEDLPEERDKS